MPVSPRDSPGEKFRHEPPPKNIAGEDEVAKEEDGFEITVDARVDVNRNYFRLGVQRFLAVFGHAYQIRLSWPWWVSPTLPSFFGGPSGTADARKLVTGGG